MSIDVAPYHALPHSSVPLFPAKPLMICSLLFKAGGKKKVQKTSSYGKEKSGHSDWSADSGHIQ